MRRRRQVKMGRQRRGVRYAALALVLMSVLAGVVSEGSAQVYPPGSIFAAGSVYPNSVVQSNTIAGGYFGNGDGQIYDLAVTNVPSVAGGPVLSVLLGNGNGAFASPTNYAFAGSVIQVGLSTVYGGPLRAPGSVDLAATDALGNLVLIPGNGDGTFGTPVALNQVANTLQTFPNSNGTLNLIAGKLTYSATLNESLSTITILINDGSGAFSAQTLLSNSTWQVAEVDYLNLAGTPTFLLLGVDGTARTATYINGAFGPLTTFNLNLPAGSGAAGGVVSFVLNGNTCFAAIANGDVFIWHGNADGSFQAPVEQNIAAYAPVQLATTDLNGDQIADLVVLGGGQSTTVQNIIPLYGNSTGVFSPEFRTGPGVYGSQLVIGDANGDGHPDLMLAEANQGITVLLNQGDGTFAAPKTFASSGLIINDALVPDYPAGVATAALNGDGVPDLVVANGINPTTDVNTNTVSTFIGDGNGVFSYAGDIAVSPQPVGLALATSGGTTDAFVINGLNGNVDFLQWNDGTFTSQGTFTGGLLAQGAEGVAIVTGAIGPSGAAGVVVGDGAGGITVFTSPDGVSWSATAQYTTGSGVGSITSMALIDVNGDGIPDLLVALGATAGYNSGGDNTVNSGSVLVFAGTGNGTFAAPVSLTSTQANWNPGFVTAGFLTGNADADIVVVNGSYCGPCALTGPATPPRTIAIFSGSSLADRQETDLSSPLDGIATQTPSPAIPTQSAAVADVNADGVSDLVLSYGGLVGVLPGQGAGLFGPPVVQVASTDTSGFVTGSFFNPGGHDVVVASSQGVTPLESLAGTGGTQATPYAEFSPVSLDFSNAMPGSPVTLPLTLTNHGTATLSVPIFGIQANSTGAPAPEFTTTGVQCGSVTNPAAIELAPNASCTITVQFNPTGSGNYSAQLVLTDNAAQSNVASTAIVGLAPWQQTIPISGVGTTAPIQISPSSLPAATLNMAYSQAITATGGSGGYTFVESGALPPGITFNVASFVLSGTATKAGTFPITIAATDSSGNSTTVTYQLVVSCPNLTISPSPETLPIASIGLFYDQTFTVYGATGTPSWFVNGNLPQGVQLVTSGTNVASIDGTVAPPTGTHAFGFTVTDSAGCTVSDNYVIPVENALTVTATLPVASIGESYAGSFSASGGTGPYTYTYDTLNQPPGLTLNAQTGALTGIPTQAGTFPIGVIATDSLGVQGTVLVTLTVHAVTIAISDAETITVSDNSPQVALIDVSDPNEAIKVTDTVLVRYVPAVVWPTPAPIVYGTRLNGAQLDATATVGGTFTYSPALGTILPAGSQTLSVTFTPSNLAKYSPTAATVMLQVSQAEPLVIWVPLPLLYGKPLGSFQLDAFSLEPGKFVYTPPAGTLLPVGNQPLSAVFTPTNTNFKIVTIHATVDVIRPPKT